MAKTEFQKLETGMKCIYHATRKRRIKSYDQLMQVSGLASMRISQLIQNGYLEKRYGSYRWLKDEPEMRDALSLPVQKSPTKLQGATRRKVTMFLKLLPDHFSLQEALKAGESMGISKATVKRWLRYSKKIQRTERGEYKKASAQTQLKIQPKTVKEMRGRKKVSILWGLLTIEL